MSNPHYEAAISERFAGDWRFTEAVLAVAWEARTANLIALAQLNYDMGHHEAAYSIAGQSEERL